jgi:serine/threonine protein kinase/tetratricopeptide (TPR) repeat protein
MQRFPAVLADSGAVLDLIFQEAFLRKQQGIYAAKEEYLSRFPELAPEIEARFGAGWSGRTFPWGADTFSRASGGCDITVNGLDLLGEPAIPGYEILGELARGGMGVVYKAHDAGIPRDVAVKLMHESCRSRPLSVRRFLDEANITGQLQHPGIPPVFQVGTLADGSPFLAMKLIKGRTLEELLNDRNSPKADRGQFLAIFEQVCQAVGYAHAHGVIHRDLKPANVMVGAFGEVQVMDWGIAKVLKASADVSRPESDALTVDDEIHSARESDDATQAGTLLGTPAYIAPEQAAGAVSQVDKQSDVFGLGAVLCVILTGEPPYTGSDSEVIRLRAVRGKMDDAHSRLDRCGAEPELITLCKQCLSLEPQARPNDAGAVAGSVHSLRAAAEDRARQAELDRVAAEVRGAEGRKRRRVQAALAAVVLVAASGAIAAAFWQQQRRAVAEADRVARLSRTGTSITAAIADARDRTAEAWGLADQPARMRTAAEFAEAAIRRGEGFASAGESSEEAMGELATAQAEVADLLRHTRFLVEIEQINNDHLSQRTGGFDYHLRARRLTAAFRKFGLDVMSEPPQSVAAAVVASRVREKLLGFLFEWHFGAPDAVQRKRLQAILQSATQLADGIVGRALQLKSTNDIGGIAALAASPEVLTLGPELIGAIGRDLRSAGRHRDRLALLRKSIEKYPTAVWLQFDAREACLDLAPPLRTEALRYAGACIALRPDSPFFLKVLAEAYEKVGTVERAADAYRQAVVLAPNNAVLHNDLGHALGRVGNSEGEVAEYREAIRLDPSYAWPHNNLGSCMLRKGDLNGAIAECREAIRLEPRFPLAHYNLGRALRMNGDLAAALAADQTSVRLNPTSANAHHELGVVLYANKDVDEAITEYRKAIRLSPRLAAAHNDLGLALHSKKDLHGAIEAYKEAIRLDSRYASAHANLGLVLQEKGDLKGATACYSEAIRFDPKLASVHNALAWVLAVGPHAIREGRRAVEHSIRACELTEWKEPNYIDTLAAAYAEAGEFDKAIEYQKKAMTFPTFEKNRGSAARYRLDAYTRKEPYRDPELAIH